MDYRISVVIPAYNAERFLPRALDSVFAQSEPVHEVIVVDDGSKDGTEQVVRSYGDRVRYLRQENSGAAVARNRGIREATGNWIAFLDSDDFWYRSKLACQLSVLRRHDELRWCFCEFHFRDRERLLKHVYTPGAWQERADDGIVPFFPAGLAGVNVHTSGLVIAREVFEEVGYFDPELRRGQDLDMWWRIALRYPLIGYCKERVYCFDADINPHGNRYNVVGKMRQLSRTLLRARDVSAQAERDYLAFALRHMVLRLCIVRARRMDVTEDEIRYHEGLFKLPGWQRASLRLLGRSPRIVRSGVEQLLWWWIHPQKYQPCDFSEMPAEFRVTCQGGAGDGKAAG